MRIIVAGSRSIKDVEFVKGKINDILLIMGDKNFKISELVSGCSGGVDTIAEDWAIENGVPTKLMPAHWGDIDVKGAIIRYNKFGKPYNILAGLQRNEKMAIYASGEKDKGLPGALIAIWDGKSNGTRNMILHAKKYRLITCVWNQLEERKRESK